jgi:hypothetical protein
MNLSSPAKIVINDFIVAKNKDKDKIYHLAFCIVNMGDISALDSVTLLPTPQSEKREGGA